MLHGRKARPFSLDSPSDHDSHAEYKDAAKHAAWEARAGIAAKFHKLRDEAPHEAERYLSRFLKPRSDFTSALVDTHGDPMSEIQMVNTLVDDLMARAHNNLPQDPSAALELQRAVSTIRSSGAAPRGGSSAHRDIPYSGKEVAEAIDGIKAGKRCLFGVGSAVKAPCGPGRRLTASLVNAGRHMAITSTLWSLRQFNPIHKSGPKIVRRTECLRPVSFGSDVAQVQDSLWLMRNANLIELFCGEAQVGGISDSISLVVASVLLCQLREFQGFATYLALTDLRHAFDHASIDGMLLNCYLAGVISRDWLLIDDILRQDRRVLELHGILSGR